MDRAVLVDRFKACMREEHKHSDMGAASVIAAAVAAPSRVLEAVKTLTDGSTFFETLLKLLKNKGLDSVDFYTAANISAQTWSQMQDRTHNVSKTTVFRAAMTLKLDYLDAAILMEKAGYTFRSSDRMDMVVTCLLKVGIYDHRLIDELLCDNSLPPLFSQR